MKIAYLDCFSGISGDMFLGALLDAGLPFKVLKQRLKTLSLKNYRLETKQESRNHIFGTQFSVMLEPAEQVPRNLKDIREIIQKGDLSRTVKEKALETFEQIAAVEGKIHNTPPEDVHFHEVGAVDSIIDIVGTLMGIEYLDLGSLYASHIPLGSGFGKAGHGKIPVPAGKIPVVKPGRKKYLSRPEKSHHPMGGGEGRSSSGRHPCTPWGVPTKGYRTRKNKRTDKFIVKRRSKR